MQTFTGKEYLKIDIASNFGLEKSSWDDRISWFDKHESQLENLLTQAEEPALYYAGVNAWRAVQRSEPIGYMISLDATSSGLQILAALTGDRSAAELCNVVDVGNRQDAYGEIFGAMLQQTGQGSGITREMAKEAIMTSLYGSTAVPKRIFGEGPNLKAFYAAMETMAPAAWELNQIMLSLWDPRADTYKWTLPDNFNVITKVTDIVKEKVFIMGDPFEVSYKVNQPTENGRSLGANMVHSIDGMIVREISRRCDHKPEIIEQLSWLLERPELCGQEAITEDDKLVLALWDHYNHSGYLSARILDHLNVKNLGHVNPAAIKDLISTLPDKPFHVVAIHDCFRCLPSYGNDLRYQYNLQLALIARSNLLQYLISQLIGKTTQVGKLDPYLYKDVLDANYALS